MSTPAIRTLVASMVFVGTAVPAVAAGLAIGSELPSSSWRVVGLPQQTKPFTRFSVVDLDGHHAMRVEADSSYGNVVYTLGSDSPHARLSWRWRVDEFPADADLRSRRGDDTALKVCTLWDLPLEKVPFVERQLLKAARSRTQDPVPGASVCYVWDEHLANGETLDNAFTRRIRYVVLRGADAAPKQWMLEKRDIAADFAKLFGSESAELPPLIGIAVGADADNTKGHSVGYVADLQID